MSRTNEQIAKDAALIYYKAAHGESAQLYCDTQGRSMLSSHILAALNEATAQRDAENARLRAQLASIEEDGTDEHNAAIKLRQQVAQLRAALAVARGLATAQKDYIDLLVAELNDVVPLATIHHWRTTRAEAGVKARSEIAKAEQALARIEKLTGEMS